MLNRDLEGERELVLEWGGDADARARVRDADGADLKAFNTLPAAEQQ